MPTLKIEQGVIDSYALKVRALRDRFYLTTQVDLSDLGSTKLEKTL